MLEPHDFVVPIIDVEFPEVRKKTFAEWSNMESLVPRPSVSTQGMFLEMRARPSAPILRHVIRREAYERTLTVREQNRASGLLSKPKETNRYVPPSDPSASSANHQHLATSGFTTTGRGPKEQRAPHNRGLPPIVRHISPPPKKVSPVADDVGGGAPGDAQGRATAGGAAPEGTEKRHLSAMERQAEGISEVLWTEKRPKQPSPSPGGMHSNSSSWDDYYNKQRATITATHKFTWGGRHTYKSPDSDPERRLNFQAGAFRRPLQLH
mmetsp:Transcript_23012/g.59023  ORF Transcript_23012/g.59023 Transcript_23012/m.59023 type:complete len:266 (-) Transcript_23012:878-1675(-)